MICHLCAKTKGDALKISKKLLIPYPLLLCIEQTPPMLSCCDNPSLLLRRPFWAFYS